LDKSKDILLAAAMAINDRASVRDDDCGKSMARTVGFFDSLTGKEMTEREGWLFMACVKLSRSQQGQYHEDDYIDAAAYIALAGAAAYGEVRPTRNGPSVGKDLPEDEGDVHGPDADETFIYKEPVVDLSLLPFAKTKENDK